MVYRINSESIHNDPIITLREVYEECLKCKNSEFTMVILTKYEKDIRLDKYKPVGCFIHIYKTIEKAMIDIPKWQKELVALEVFTIGNGWYFRLFYKRFNESILISRLNYRIEYYFDLNGCWCDEPKIREMLDSNEIIQSSVITHF
jgi:hypothetical protein